MQFDQVHFRALARFTCIILSSVLKFKITCFMSSSFFIRWNCFCFIAKVLFTSSSLMWQSGEESLAGVVGLVGDRGVLGLLAGVPWRWAGCAGVVGRLGIRGVVGRLGRWGVCGRLDGRLLGVCGRLLGDGVRGQLWGDSGRKVNNWS